MSPGSTGTSIFACVCDQRTRNIWRYRKTIVSLQSAHPYRSCVSNLVSRCQEGTLRDAFLGNPPHLLCIQGKFRGSSLPVHLHDLDRLVGFKVISPLVGHRAEPLFGQAQLRGNSE